MPSGEMERRRVPAAAVVAVAVVAVCWGMQATAFLVAPAFLVISLVISVEPLRARLVAHRVPAGIASAVALVLVYLLLVVVLGSLLWSLGELVAILPTYSQPLADLGRQTVELLAGVGLDQDALERIFSSMDLSSFGGLIQAALGSLSGGLSTLGLFAMLAFFFTMDADGFTDRLTLIGAHRPSLAAGLREFAVEVRQYWLVTTFFGVVMAVLDTIALAMIGVPLAITWGVLAFVTNYIPNIGFVIGLIPPTLLALVHGGPVSALLVVVSYTTLNFLIQTLLQPRITGDVVGISPSVALVSLLFWAFILGPLGALLAIPMTLLVKAVLVDTAPGGSWLAGLLDSLSRVRRAVTPSG